MSIISDRLLNEYKQILMILRDFFVFVSVWTKLWVFCGIFSWSTIAIMYIIYSDTYFIPTEHHTLIHTTILSWSLAIYWLIGSFVLFTAFVSGIKLGRRLNLSSLRVGSALNVFGLLLEVPFAFLFIISGGWMLIGNVGRFFGALVIVGALFSFIGSILLAYSFYSLGQQENISTLIWGGIFLPILPILGLPLLAKALGSLASRVRPLIRKPKKIREFLSISKKYCETPEIIAEKYSMPIFIIRGLCYTRSQEY